MKMFNQDPKQEHQNQKEEEPAVEPAVQERFERLSLIPYHLGKDFSMNLELSADADEMGWQRDTASLQVPAELLTSEHEDVVRSQVAQVGAHKRVSRLNEKVSGLLQEEPAFGVLLSQLLHPRAANYACHAVPELKTSIQEAHQERLGTSKTRLSRIKEQLGYKPEFIELAQEYGRAWLREKQGKPLHDSSRLNSKLVDSIVNETIDDASEAWNYYPSKKEADRGESAIQAYSDKSLEIVVEKIWPRFKEVLEQDKKKGAASKWMKQQSQQSGGAPKEVQKKLSESQKKSLEKSIQLSKESGTTPDLSDIDEETRKAILEEFDKLSEEEKKEFLQQAATELEQAALDAEGKEDSEAKDAMEVGEEEARSQDSGDKSSSTQRRASPYRQAANAILKPDLTKYDLMVAHYYSDIKRLVGSIQTVLKQRESKSVTGYSQGPRLNVSRRINEVARGVPAHESKAWKRTREAGELDYGFSILIDLSSSMNGEKVNQAFNAAVIVTEALEQVGLPVEVLGFNSQLFELKSFDDSMNISTKEKLGGMTQSTGSCTDLGWAMSQASGRLQMNRSKHRTLIVLTDGEPYPSSSHSGKEFEVSTVLHGIHDNKQHVLAVGLQVPEHTMRKHFGDTPMLAGIAAEQLPVVFARAVENAIRGRKNV